eukprot:117841_1
MLKYKFIAQDIYDIDSSLSISKQERIQKHHLDSTNTGECSSNLQWLEKIILYLPIWIPINPSLKQRNKCLNYFMSFIILSYSIGYIIYVGYDTKKYFNDNLFKIDLINDIIMNCVDIPVVISRMIGFYYFYCR